MVYQFIHAPVIENYIESYAAAGRILSEAKNDND